MRKRITAGLAILMAALVVTIGTVSQGLTQDKEKDKEKDKDKDKKANPPKLLYGRDPMVRSGGKKDFNMETPRIGVEFFHDETTNSLIAISEIGALAVAPNKTPGTEKQFSWLTGHDFSVRKAGEKEFTQKTKKFGVEMYRDLASNELFYITEVGAIALAPIPAGLVTTKGPVWRHAAEFHVRSYDQDTFDNAKKIGVETFVDENTGGLVYLSEIGAISAAPAPATAPDPKGPSLAPKAAYALNLRVRSANEANFTSKTAKIGVEIFEDPNANNMLFYISEPGYIAALPSRPFIAGGKGVMWKHAMKLAVRKAGETSLQSAKRFGIEVFADNRTGNLIFISETGSLAVLPKQ